jgi:predicted  nucleic acid-binding Zn-ribbon protein
MDELKSLADLLDLQVVDSEIDRLIHERESVPALTDYRRAHTALEAVTKEHDEAASLLRELELALDKTSGELELAEAKLASEQNRLYAGGLSARDADYLRREVEILGRKKSEMEDEVLELMERREETATSLEALQASVSEANAEKQRLEEIITDAWKDIDARLARKERRKADIVPLISDELLDLYERLRSQKDDGVAVGRLAEGVCGACHLRLTPAEQNEATRRDPPRCIHCSGILVP